MNKVKALIVDDEQGACDNLKYLIKRSQLPIHIIACVNSVDDAIKVIDQESPDIVFLDIEMPRKNGFELLKAFKSINFHIIFVTAYSQYAINAFEVSAVDYLLKPINYERLTVALNKVLKLNNTSAISRLENNIKNKKIETLAIPHKDDFAIIRIEDILYIQANRMYSEITVRPSNRYQKQKYIYAKKMGDLEVFLADNDFMRVHRSWLVNLKSIFKYSKKQGTISMENNFDIPVSKTYKAELETILKTSIKE